MEAIIMTNEKRGTEKLMDVEDGLCSLTADELMQVAGGCPTDIDWSTITIDIPSRFPNFPLGQFPPDLFEGQFGGGFRNFWFD